MKEGREKKCALQVPHSPMVLGLHSVTMLIAQRSAQRTNNVTVGRSCSAAMRRQLRRCGCTCPSP